MEERFRTFTVLIANVSRCIRRIKTEEMSDINLKSPHVSCLYYLYKFEKGLTAKELCDICKEDKAAMSRSIEYLEKEGYVACEETAKKRYKSPFFLTEKGKKAGEVVAKKIDDILARASVGLSEEHRLIFYRSLALISDNLQKICEDYEDGTEGDEG